MWISLYLFTPLFVIAIAIAVGLPIRPTGPLLGDLSTPAVLTLACIAQLCLSVALSLKDRDALHATGHRQAASPLWNLLSPLAYLTARWVAVHRVTGSGSEPLFAFIVLYSVPLGLLGLSSLIWSGLS